MNMGIWTTNPQLVKSQVTYPVQTFAPLVLGIANTEYEISNSFFFRAWGLFLKFQGIWI